MENTEVEIILVEDSMDDAELTIRARTKNNIANNLVHVKDGASEISPVHLGRIATSLSLLRFDGFMKAIFILDSSRSNSRLNDKQ